MPEIILTDEQNEAIAWIVGQINAEVPAVALRGLAGTGKTSIIPALQEAIQALGMGVAIGAATHRAKMVLRRKGMDKAQTYHKLAMTPHFTGDYAKAIAWFGEECPCFEEDSAKARADIEGIPPLIHEHLVKLPRLARRTPESLKREWPKHEAKDILRSIGLSGEKYITRWGPKDGIGCIIIDEASMLSQENLATCTQAFPSVVLVGDPGQLPPVNAQSALETVDGFELTQIQRQAKDSSIIQLAYTAREGRPFWQRIPVVPREIERWQGVAAGEFLQSPLIVGQNHTRKACTKAIRAALGYPADRPVVGEPIICRTNDRKYKGGAFYNNALFRVVDVDESDDREVRLREEDSEDEHDITIHLEEIDGPNIPLGAVQCRFGYVYTAHTAQGGEWSTVYVSEPDLIAWRNVLRSKHMLGQFPLWSYTVITRAKTKLVFVAEHNFTITKRPKIGDAMPKIQRHDTIAPPSAPMLNADPYEPADIPDPAVPPGTISAAEEAIFGPEPSLAEQAMCQDIPGVPIAASTMPQDAPERAAGTFTPPTLPEGSEALLRGFTQYMHAQLRDLLLAESLRIAKSTEVTIASMADYCKGVLQSKAYGENDMPEALRHVVSEGIKVHGAPYVMQLSALTPGGFAIAFTVSKDTGQELMQAVAGMEGWLLEHNYTGVQAVSL